MFYVMTGEPMMPGGTWRACRVSSPRPAGLAVVRTLASTPVPVLANAAPMPSAAGQPLLRAHSSTATLTSTCSLATRRPADAPLAASAQTAAMRPTGRCPALSGRLGRRP